MGVGPIKLERGGLVLSHLFFIDDLVLFGEASVENAKVVLGILEKFFYYSGHRMNAHKSKIFFSNNTGASTKMLLVVY